MPNWGAAYLAITSMGAVAVPILPDFTPGEIANVLNHSEAKALFLSGNLAHKVAEFKPEALETVIAIDDFRITSRNEPGTFVAGLNRQENTM